MEQVCAGSRLKTLFRIGPVHVWVAKGNVLVSFASKHRSFFLGWSHVTHICLMSYELAKCGI